MRLLTHNMLLCNVKQCGPPDNFPLLLRPAPAPAEEGEEGSPWADGAVAVQESEFNPQFLLHMLPRLEWSALRAAAADLGLELPEHIPEDPSADEAFLRGLHLALLDTHLEEGALVCRNCGRAYPVTRGVPNMLLNEDEV